jgi:hypothetical protein
MDLDHAVQLVTERTQDRYEQYLSRPEVADKFEHLNATAANVAGINRWLDQVDGAAAPMDDPSRLR